MKRLWFVLASPAVLVLLAFLSWLGSEAYHARSSSAEGIVTYQDYRKSMPTPRALRKLTKDGEEFHVFFGPIKSPLALPSGPPAYVFDMNGWLVDWTHDTGDDPRFSSAWAAYQGEELDIDHFGKLIEPKEDAGHRVGGMR